VDDYRSRSQLLELRRYDQPRRLVTRFDLDFTICWDAEGLQCPREQGQHLRLKRPNHRQGASIEFASLDGQGEVEVVSGALKRCRFAVAPEKHVTYDRRVTRAAAIASLVAFAALTPAAHARPVGTFVGKAGPVAVGVVMDARAVRAYACDGRRLGQWFDKRSRGDSVRLGAGARLLARGSRVSVRLRGRTVKLRRASGRAGLYRADTTRAGRRRLAGWVVQRSGRQTGTLATQAVVGPAPQLSTSNLLAGSGTTQLTAGFVLPPGPQAVIADPANDGFDLSGRVTSSIAGGGTRQLRWTRSGDDDIFIALDTGVLRSAGYRLANEAGTQLTGTVLARGGLTLRDPGGNSITTSDGVQLVHLLDRNRDSVISRADPAGGALRDFRDANGDGQVGLGELAESLRNERDEWKARFQALDQSTNEALTLLVSIVKTVSVIRAGGVTLSTGL